jgi:ABC-type multidrug transport system fused ATPase/permease subunit
MLRKLLASVRQYKKETFLTPAFVTVETILEIIIPTLMASLIDYGINAKNMSYVLWIGLTLVVLAAFSLLTGYLAGRNAAIAAAGFASNLLSKMEEYGMALPSPEKTALVLDRHLHLSPADRVGWTGISSGRFLINHEEGARGAPHEKHGQKRTTLPVMEGDFSFGCSE